MQGLNDGVACPIRRPVQPQSKAHGLFWNNLTSLTLKLRDARASSRKGTLKNSRAGGLLLPDAKTWEKPTATDTGQRCFGESLTVSRLHRWLTTAVLPRCREESREPIG